MFISIHEGVRATDVIVSLSKDDFELRTSTGSGLFELFNRDFKQILGQIVSIRVKTLSNTNLVASKRKGSLPVNARRSLDSLLGTLRSDNGYVHENVPEK